MAIAIVGLIAVGVPARTVLLGAIGLVCVLMMVTMMSGMHGGNGGARNAPTGYSKTKPRNPPSGGSAPTR